jgi:hypothetical protein
MGTAADAPLLGTWWREPDSNWRPSAYEADELPTALSRCEKSTAKTKAPQGGQPKRRNFEDSPIQPHGPVWERVRRHFPVRGRLTKLVYHDYFGFLNEPVLAGGVVGMGVKLTVTPIDCVS